jgi:hypothetical protein
LAAVELRVLIWTAGRTPVATADSVIGGVGWDAALLRDVPARRAAQLDAGPYAERRGLAVAGSVPARLFAALRIRGPDRRMASVIVARNDRIIAERAERARMRTAAAAHGVHLACGLWLVNLVGLEDGQPAWPAARTAADRWADGDPLLVASDGDEPVRVSGDVSLIRPAVPRPDVLIVELRLMER